MGVLTDAQTTTVPPPVPPQDSIPLDTPATSYEYETEPVPQVEDLLPEKAPLYQAELPEGAQPEAAQVDPTSTQIADTPTVTAEESQAALAHLQSPEALAETHLNRITSQDSPLMQAARLRANQASNRRGLLNSSLAAGAAQRAMVEAATPLALQNAAQAHRAILQNAEMQTLVDRANVDRQLQAGMFTAEQHNKIAVENARIATEMTEFSARERNAVRDANAARYAALQQSNTAEANRHAQFIMQMEMELSKQYLAGEAALSLADLQGRYQTTVSTNASAAQMFEAYFNGISATLSNSTLSTSAIASRINVQKQFLEAGMEMLSAISDIDFDVELPEDVAEVGYQQIGTPEEEPAP